MCVCVCVGPRAVVVGAAHTRVRVRARAVSSSSVVDRRMAGTGVSFRTDTRTLASMVDARVSVITNDGRHIVGVLRGFDQVVNVILEDCHERVYSTTSGVEHAPLGLYMIRGDNMCVLCSCACVLCVCVCCCVLLRASSRGVDLKPTPQRLTWSFRVLHDITEPSSVRSTKI